MSDIVRFGNSKDNRELQIHSVYEYKTPGTFTLNIPKEVKMAKVTGVGAGGGDVAGGVTSFGSLVSLSGGTGTSKGIGGESFNYYYGLGAKDFYASLKYGAGAAVGYETSANFSGKAPGAGGDGGAGLDAIKAMNKGTYTIDASIGGGGAGILDYPITGLPSSIVITIGKAGEYSGAYKPTGGHMSVILYK